MNYKNIFIHRNDGAWVSIGRIEKDLKEFVRSEISKGTFDWDKTFEAFQVNAGVPVPAVMWNSIASELGVSCN